MVAIVAVAAVDTADRTAPRRTLRAIAVEEVAVEAIVVEMVDAAAVGMGAVETAGAVVVEEEETERLMIL